MARTRTFLAIDVGEAIRAKSVAVQKELAASGAAVKWVEPANLHITLHFLGELSDRDLADVCRLAVRAAVRVSPFRIAVGGLGAFPNLRRPKVLWAGVNEGADELIELFAAIEAPLAEAGFYRKEDRPYTPHLTLGRLNDEAAGAMLAPALAELRGWTAGVTHIEEVQIMTSDLRRDGPEYTVIGRCPLS